MELTEYSDHHPRHGAAVPKLSYKPAPYAPPPKRRCMKWSIFLLFLLTLGISALVLLHLFNQDTFLPTPLPTRPPHHPPTPPHTIPSSSFTPKPQLLSNLLYKTTVTAYPTNLKKRANRFLF